MTNSVKKRTLKIKALERKLRKSKLSPNYDIKQGLRLISRMKLNKAGKKSKTKKSKTKKSKTKK